MIEGQGLIKRYASHTVLDGATLSVGPGDRVVLHGDNGSGKTTLLHVLMGLRRPNAGGVRWKGRLLTGAGTRAWRHARAAWGFLPQQLSLPPRQPVGRLLRFHARLRGREVESTRVWLERIGLGDRERQPVGTLSGGMRQRLAIALTMFHEPELIVMDEPGNSLDPRWRHELTRWIAEAAEHGAGALIASQLEEPWGSDVCRYQCEAGRVMARAETADIAESRT